MDNIKILGEKLSNIPWQNRPEGCSDVVWRHEESNNKLESN